MNYATQNYAQSHAPTAGFVLPGFGFTTEAAQNSLQDDPNGLHPKKRKVAHEEEDYAQFASGDLDADVAELLQQESNLPK
ncbi:hypothetical protein AFLA_000444 [Aspergillus flavus NRRL3357]|nr:hypothetical protein AFLA_000444 [Aspergillus flavus NRRL3357]